MLYTIYIIISDEYPLFLDDIECASFYVNYLNDSSYIYDLPIKSDSLISSDVVLSLSKFLTYIEKEFEFILNNAKIDDKYSVYKNYLKLKNKLRDKILNKILNE